MINKQKNEIKDSLAYASTFDLCHFNLNENKHLGESFGQMVFYIQNRKN